MAGVFWESQSIFWPWLKGYEKIMEQLKNVFEMGLFSLNIVIVVVMIVVIAIFAWGMMSPKRIEK